MTNQQISMVIELQKLGMQKASDCYGTVIMKMRENPPAWVADLTFSPNHIQAAVAPDGAVTWSSPAIPDALLRRMVRCKSTEPDPYADEPPPRDEDEPDEEPGRLAKGAVYNLSDLRLRGWWTPLGFKHSMEGYFVAEYFEGTDDIAKYLGPDSFGVEPLFESL